jgi:hypothetical protein
MRPPPVRNVRIGEKDTEDVELVEGEPDPLMKDYESSEPDNGNSTLNSNKLDQTKVCSKTTADENLECRDIHLKESQSLTVEVTRSEISVGIAHTGEQTLDKTHDVSRTKCSCLTKCLKGNIVLEWEFWVFALAIVLYRIDFTNFPHIAPDFALVTGHSKLEAHILINIIGGSLIPARILGGHILDRPWANVFIIVVVNLVLFGTISLAFPFARDTYWLMAVLTGCRGAIQGIIAIFPVPMGVTLFGVERITSALAYFNMCKGFGDLISAPLAGKISCLLLRSLGSF